MSKYTYTILYERGTPPLFHDDEDWGAEVLILRSHKHNPEKLESVLVDHRGVWWHWLRIILTHREGITEEYYTDRYLPEGYFYWRRDKKIDEEVSRQKEEYEMIKGDNLESLFTMLELIV